MSKRIAIVGSRSYPDLEAVDLFVEGLPPDTVIVSGGARGVDQRAAEAARKRGLTVEEFLPDYETHGPKFAPLARNTTIANKCDELVAFWDRLSSGTKDVMRKAHNRKKPVTLFEPCSTCRKTLPKHHGWCAFGSSSEHPF